MKLTDWTRPIAIRLGRKLMAYGQRRVSITEQAHIDQLIAINNGMKKSLQVQNVKIGKIEHKYSELNNRLLAVEEKTK